MANVNEFIKIFNKNRHLSLEMMYSVKKRFLGLYRAAMMVMYDEGYIGDPTCFNELEIRKNILDMDVKGMVRSSGKMFLTSEQVGFALCKNKNNEDAISFLKSLEKVLHYRECCEEVDVLYDSVFNGFKKNVEGDFYSVSMSLRQSGPFIKQFKPYKVGEGTISCLFKDALLGKAIKYVDFNDKIYELCLKELGLENNSDKGIFVKGFTKAEEQRFVKLIMDGEISLTGPKAGILSKWLKQHAWNMDVSEKYRNIRIGLYSYVIANNTGDIFQFQQRLLDRCIQEYGAENIISMDTTGFYCSYPVEYEDVSASIFVVFAGEEDVISTNDRNSLEGYTGEVYEIGYLEREKAIYTGCPIVLYLPDEGKKRKTTLVVDLEQTEYYKKGKRNITWFSFNGANVSFDYSIYKKGKFPEGTYEDNLFRLYGDSEMGTVFDKIPSRKSSDDLESYERSKDLVYNEVIRDDKYKVRKDAILRVYNGDEIGGVTLLKGEFSSIQIRVLVEAIKNGTSFEKVWYAADPINSSEEMKKRLK